MNQDLALKCIQIFSKTRVSNFLANWAKLSCTKFRNGQNLQYYLPEFSRIVIYKGSNETFRHWAALLMLLV